MLNIHTPCPRPVDRELRVPLFDSSYSLLPLHRTLVLYRLLHPTRCGGVSSAVRFTQSILSPSAPQERPTEALVLDRGRGEVRVVVDRLPRDLAEGLWR